MSAERAAAQMPAPPANGGARMLQRKCACGGGGAREECECPDTKRLQPKLRMSNAGDPLEEEADRVADRVLRFPATQPGTAPVAMRATSASADLHEPPAEVGHALQSTGRPLDDSTRSFFEARFGHDFSRVRIHADAGAAASLRAQAFTVGSDIVFDQGRYAPGTESGRRLLAHELSHVVQQGSGGPPVLSRFPDPGPKTPYKAVVLTLDEILKDPSREAARKNSGQTAAKACRSIASNVKLDGDNCPAVLDEHAVVTVTQEKVGGLWLQIDATGLPNVGPQETLHVLGAFLKPREAPAAPAIKPTPPKPSAAEQAKLRTALKEAHAAAAGVRGQAEYAQLRCMVPLGACPHSRPGGLPDDKEFKEYNDECRKTTGYDRPDVIPQAGECEDLAPLGSEEMVRPGRLAQVKDLLLQYAKLVQAGALDDGEIANMDGAISRAERELGGLLPSGGATRGPDEAPWAVASKDGGAVQAPSLLAAGATMSPAMTRLAFSAAARAATNPGTLVGLLVVTGLVVTAYLIADHLLRKSASMTLEVLLAELLTLLQKYTEAQIEKKVRDKTDPKAKPKLPKVPRPWPPVGGVQELPECTFEEVGSGGDPLADLFCEEVTGSTKGKDILVTTPEGDKAWYDALQSLLATECKCGYASVVEAFDRAERTGGKVPFWAEARMEKLDQQKGRGVRVALRCGLKLRYYVSNKRVADFLNERWSMGQDFVFWTPSDHCD